MSNNNNNNNNNKKKAWAPQDVEDWATYMEAKKAKLEDQFDEEAKNEFQDATSLFRGVAIFVNGYTNPCADELKRLMMAHGGIYHHYMRPRITTHIIASNLPYSKIVAYRKSQNPLPLCKPEWITDSLKAEKLLDWRPYVLYSNCTKTQPQLQFKENLGHSLISSTMKNTNIEKSEPEVQQSVKNISSKVVSSNEGKNSGGILCSKDSEFLSEFYNNSRLHHISTMGATFKDYVNELREKSNGKFDGFERLKKLPRSAAPERIIDRVESDSDEDLFEERSEIKVNPEKSGARATVIMHIDMDCFFVSVGLRNKPELRGLPVAVTHAKGKQPLKSASSSKNLDPDEEAEEFVSMSEVASCSYEARKMGVKNGMFLGQALKLCPNLKTIKYDFEGYKKVSYILYDTVASYTLNIEAVSCDEMYADMTSVLVHSQLSPLEFATVIREEIKKKTGCPVSTGFGSNKLQARLATRKAKPDGQFYLESNQVQVYIGSMVVRDLPGVGSSTTHLLHKMNVRTCSDLQSVSLGVLQKEFGKKTGEMLHNMSRGIDNSKLTFEHVRKSVSAEVNYGIRFESSADADEFLRKLCQEVSCRLTKANAKGRSITLKLMIRAKDAPKEAMKFMGHGVCDNFTKSKNLIAPTDDPVIITREVLSLWSQMQQTPEDVRGIGIQIARLESLKSRAGNSNLMNFINKAKLQESEPETTMNILRNSKPETLRPIANSNPIDVVSTKNTKEKPKGLKAFLVPKDRLPVIPNKNSSTNNQKQGAVDVTEIGEIDEAVLAELPEDIRMEILKATGDRFLHTRSGTQPSTSAAPDSINDLPAALPCDQIKEKYSQHCLESVDGIEKEIDLTENIDQKVLNELPEDIRKEILASKTASQLRQTHQESYFKHAKSSSGRRGKASMPPIEDIDMSVLIELPEDIRNEIINEYKAKKQTREDNNHTDNNTIVVNKPTTTATARQNKRVQEEDVNVSFSQVDPEFLAALSDDMKTDVRIYCMAKKKQNQLKIKKASEVTAVPAPLGKNRNVTKTNKKATRLPKAKNIIKLKKSPEVTTKTETVKVRELQHKEKSKNSRTSGRFFENELTDEPETNGSQKQREEIISHHSSFSGKKAETDEHRKMMTSLVNYLFTVPFQQVKVQIQTWISNSKVVNDIDLLSLATYLSMLPKKKRLEELHILLKTMHRCIIKTESCVWHETYGTTVAHVQRYMQIEYNSNLMLPRIDCKICESRKTSL